MMSAWCTIVSSCLVCLPMPISHPHASAVRIFWETVSVCMEIRLVRWKLPSADCGRIVGVVRNPQNEIVPSGRVVLVPEPDLRSRRDLFKVATLDQYGRFNIQGIRPGRYKLFAWDDVPFGAYFDSEFRRSYEEQAKAVSVQKNDYIQAEITLTPRVVKTGELVER